MFHIGRHSVFTARVVFRLAYALILDAWPMTVADVVTLALTGTVPGLKLRRG